MDIVVIGAPGALADVLDRHGALPAAFAHDREKLLPSRIYAAPPERHLLIEGTLLRVVNGPRENDFRPAIDPLFRTAANSFGERAVGVVLSGIREVITRIGNQLAPDEEDASRAPTRLRGSSPGSREVR